MRDNKYIALTISLLVKVVLNLFVIFYIAKKVSITDFGSFSIAFIISSLITLFLDYGFNLKGLILTSKEKNEINIELSSMFFAKLVLAFIVVIFLGIFLLINEYDYSTKVIILILGISSIPNSFGIFILNNFKIVNRFNKEAQGYLIQGFALIICLLLMEAMSINNLLFYALALLLSRLLFFFFGIYCFLNTKYFTLIATNFRDILMSLNTSLPYAVHLILGSLIIYIDTFILSYLTDLYNVGLYQSGMRIIMSSLLISVIITDAFIPEISRNFSQRKMVTKKLAILSDFILIFTLLIAITLLFYQKSIILILFSVEHLLLQNYMLYIILIITLRYIGIVPGIILTSGNKQKIRANAVLLSILCSISLNFILIPLLGIKGAFISSLISHIILNSIYLFYTLKEVKFYNDISFPFIFSMVAVLLTINIVFFSDSKIFLLIAIIINIVTIFLYYIYRVNKKTDKDLIEVVI
jgi:O-antigen/teichoic acid export membrane protein